MSSAYSNALAGLTANAQAINIVSGNLANLSTTGYKDQKVSFQDLVNESLSGFTSSGSVSGSTIATSTQQFSQGTLQTTNGAFDAAIQGDGFFVLKNAAGQQLFTRQGNFQVDSSGHLMTATGQFVEGWNAANGALTTNGATTDIQLPTTTAPAKATTTISVGANLDANSVVNAPASPNFSSPVQVYDSLGSPHTLTVSYTKTGLNTWTYAITVPPADVTGGSAAALQTGTLTFDTSGHLTLPLSAPAPAGPIAIKSLADGAADMSIAWDPSANGNANFTQFSQASANVSNDQNGLAAGQLTSMKIGPNGTVVASYSNGTSQGVAQIALASILNPDSMQQLDGNNFVATSLTAKPAIDIPSTGARGQITGGALETSTVDIATEFTNLLQYERGYQANSKVITTEDQIIQQTIGLIPAA